MSDDSNKSQKDYFSDFGQKTTDFFKDFFTDPVKWLFCSPCCCLLVFLLIPFTIGSIISINPNWSPEYGGSEEYQGSQVDKDCLEKLGGINAKKYASLVNKWAEKYSVDAALVSAVIHQESGWNPDATSSVGAMGLMQLMPDTAKGLGVTNAYDPDQNIMGGTKYLKQQLDTFNNKVDYALAAYNAGPGAVQKYGGIPPYAETQNYVVSVKKLYENYKKCLEEQPTGGIKCDVVYLNQYDDNKPPLKAGCGPTSLAMIFQTYGKNITAIDIVKKGTQWGDPYSTGMSHPSAITSKLNGMSDLEWDSASSWSEIEQQVKDGNPVAVGTTFSGSSGHWMTITGFVANGDVIVNDPYGNHGYIWKGGYGGNYKGEQVTYNRQDFLNHFADNLSYNLYIKNPPSRINCEE